MPELILHHYWDSPFAEKIRCVLGAKKLPWRSVIIPRIMPKPDVIALTGGYRKTPVLQIGADVYCDTARIAEELDRLAPDPPLYPAAHAASAGRLAQWSDTAFFQVAVALMFQPAIAAQVFARGDSQAGGGQEDLQAFIQDRLAMRKGATTRRVPADEAQASLATFSAELDAQLGDGRTYLLGDAPTIADFSVYHPLWFVCRVPVLAAALEPHTYLRAWMGRIAALGHGEPSELSSGEAIALAKSTEPAPLEPVSRVEGLAPGDAVEVLPTDYGIDPSPGELVACTHREIAIRRTDPRAGEVTVHFPRWGYAIRRPE